MTIDLRDEACTFEWYTTNIREAGGHLLFPTYFYSTLYSLLLD